MELMRKDFFSLLIPPSNLSEMVITGFQYLTTPTRMYPTKVVKIIQSYVGVVNKMVWRKEM